MLKKKKAGKKKRKRAGKPKLAGKRKLAGKIAKKRRARKGGQKRKKKKLKSYIDSQIEKQEGDALKKIMPQNRMQLYLARLRD